MKQFFVAAGVLLLGTSALALAAQTDTTKVPLATSEMEAVKTADGYDASWDKSAIAPKPASANMAGDKLALASGDVADGKLALASSAKISNKASPVEETSPKLQTAAYESWSDDGSADPAMIPAAKTDMKAVGGPADEVASAGFSPSPAADNYPPCEPGPGDDRCIQLYEPGVRAQLASWNRPTGGLADGTATTAMGGPYEPIAQHADASASGAIGGAYPAAADAAMNDGSIGADGAAYQSVGGPVEAHSGYPPCSPGPGDDRCIQLYEPGVTGAGN